MFIWRDVEKVFGKIQYGFFENFFGRIRIDVYFFIW